MMNKLFIKLATVAAALSVLAIMCSACTLIPSKQVCGKWEISADELTEDIEKGNYKSAEPNDEFIVATADFSIDLFKRSIDEHDSSMISPLSVMLALGMTANGASGDTLAQMEQTLAGGMPIDELNGYYKGLIDRLQSNGKCKLSIADSIWLRDRIAEDVNEDFLKKTAGNYYAQVYKAPFDDSTTSDINGWVNNNTDGMIDKIIDKIDQDCVMYLINAIAFDAEWQDIYSENEVRDRDFTDIDGDTHKVSMMFSEENMYISGENVTGFVKPYDGEYSFVALLPDENISLDEYVDSLDGQTFIDLMNNVEYTSVDTGLPKFKTEYEIGMVEILKAMGMTDAFTGNADFSNMLEGLHIDEVLHKTYIEVDEKGTKAGAVTVVAMCESAVLEEYKEVILDRPFVYAIIDDETKLPVFIGTVTDI